MYDVKTQDAKYEERSTGFSDDRTTNLTAAGVESDDSRISNVQTISRVWYYETYFKKVADLSWDSNYSEDFFNDPGHGKVNNSETQYRNMTSTQMEGDTPPSTAPRMMRAAAFSASSIPSSAGYIFAGKTSANSLNNYSTNTAFAGQVAGTLKFISTKTGDYIKDKNGNVLTLSYSAGESLDSIFSRLVQLQGKTVAGKLYNLFYSIDSTQARTHAAFKGIKIEDSGNAMKLAGYATSGYSQNSNKTDSTNADYNGIKKGSASLTGSVSGLSGSTIRPFQSSSSGKATESGNDTFDVYVGSLKVGTVTYNANSTIQSVLNQIEAMQYDYATGKYVSTPFTDGKSNNDDNSFYEYSEGSQVGYVDGSGQIHYTAKLQAKLDSSGRIVITSDVYNASAQAISIKNDTGSFAKLTGLNSASITNSGTLKKGDEGTYTYTGASIAGMKGDTNLTFVGPGKFTVTIDDGSRSDTNSTVNLKQIQFDVQVLESDSVQDVLDKIVSQAKSQIASKYGVSTSSIAMSASVQNNKIVITMDGKYGENITFTNDTSNFVQRTGLSTVSKTYNENNKQVVESSGYDRITGSVDTITKDLVMGNLTSESFTISGGNGTYTINIQNGWSIQKIIDEIYSQTNGHYKAGIFNADIFNQNQQQNASNYDSAAKGSFYIESTVQTSVDTSVSDSDFTRRVGLVSSNLTTGPSEETFKGDHGYFNYYSNSIQGLKPNSIISGLKDGKLTFTLHATQATGETGSITYRPDITYTIDIAYNDTVTSILNKMKQAILIAEDEKQEHDDVIDDNRIDRLDFHVDYDPNTDSGKISLQIIGNYASGITFDSDTSGFIQALGLDTKNHTYNSNYISQEVSSGKSMITGSVQNLTESKIFGNMTEGTLTLKAGSASKTINIKSTDRIKDIIDKINEGGIFTAGLDDKGRLFIKTNDQNSNAIQVSGTSDFAKLAGLISGSWNYSATTSKGSENYSKFTGSVYGLSANQTFNNMTSGTFYIKAAGLNTVSVNVVQGVTKISDVINQINASADFSAELDEAGRLVISTKKASGSAVTIDAGSTNYTTVVGLTSGTLGGNASFVSGKQDVFSSLKGSASGLDFSSRVSAGDFKISVTDASGNTTSQTFTLSGNESISDVAAMISNSSLGLSAVIDASDNSLVIKSKTAGAFSISLQDGTSNFAELTGFTKQGSQASASVSGSLSTLTSTKTVGNVEALGFSVGDFSIALTDTNGNITQKRTINISKNDTIDTIISKINSLDLGISAIVNSNGNLVLVRNETTSAGGIAVLKGTSDFTNKIGFTSGGTLSSNASFEAGQDATKTVLTSNSLSASAASDTLASLGITDGNFIINGQNISVKAAESIASLLSKINASFGLGDQNGVYAEFTGGKIVLTSNSASSNATINIEAGTSNISEILGFTNAQKLNESAQTKGDNAIYTINGKAYESTSNIISLTDSADITQTGSADETIRFTIKNTGSGTIDIGVKSLNDAANMLNRFVNSFNSSMTMASSAELASDPAFASIIQTIKNNLFNSVGSYKQVSKELAAMGINVYSTTSTASDGERLSIAFNKSKFIEAYLADPQKVLDILVGNDSKPIDTSEAGAFTKLSDTLHNSVNPYFNSNINNIQTQIDNINQQITQNNSELTNITNTLALGSTSTSFDDMSEYLKQLEAQYKVVNDLIDNMRNNYNQSITRLVLNRF